MFLRLLVQSFVRQKRRKLLAGIAIALGCAIVTAMAAVATDVNDKMNRELRSLGANITVYPADDTLDVKLGAVDLKPSGQGAYLHESDLVQMKHIFWAHNILAYSPFLETSAKVSGQTVPVIGTYFAKPIQLEGEVFVTGVIKTHPWWKVEGAWPADDSTSVLIGSQL